MQQPAITGPALLPEMGGLTDPFNGEPFFYQPSSTGFVLHSVSGKLVDDKGTPGNRGDIVRQFQLEKRPRDI